MIINKIYNRVNIPLMTRELYAHFPINLTWLKNYVGLDTKKGAEAPRSTYLIPFA